MNGGDHDLRPEEQRDFCRNQVEHQNAGHRHHRRHRTADDVEQRLTLQAGQASLIQAEWPLQCREYPHASDGVFERAGRNAAGLQPVVHEKWRGKPENDCHHHADCPVQQLEREREVACLTRHLGIDGVPCELAVHRRGQSQIKDTQRPLQCEVEPDHPITFDAQQLQVDGDDENLDEREPPCSDEVRENVQSQPCH